MSAINQRNKEMVWELWHTVDATEPGELARILAPRVHPDHLWHGPHPLNDLPGLERLVQSFWQPFRLAFPDARRRIDIFMGGEFGGRDWISATGYFVGTFHRDWLGLTATGRQTHIRFAECVAIEGGQVIETFTILDLLDVIRQGGYELLQSEGGGQGLVPGPRAGDGILLAEQNEMEGQKSLKLVQAMVAGLESFDQHDLSTMAMTKYWHPQMHWYGPAGIGTARSLVEFEDFHQRPFLRAFPDRCVAQYDVFFGEGAFVAYAGWPCLQFTHLGPYLGYPATKKRIAMRGMDWWKREGDVLVENWVFIDMIHMFLQMGIDLLAHLNPLMHDS